MKNRPYRIYRKPLHYTGYMWTYDYIGWDGRWHRGGPHHSRIGAWFGAREALSRSHETKAYLDYLKKTSEGEPS